MTLQKEVPPGVLHPVFKDYALSKPEVSGRIGYTNSAAFVGGVEADVKQLKQEGKLIKMVLDLGGIETLDIVALEALMGLKKEVEEATNGPKGKIVFANVSEKVAMAIHLKKPDETFIVLGTPTSTS